MSVEKNENRVVFARILMLMGMSIFPNFVFGQQDVKKEKDSFPVIKIVGHAKIYSADKSFNDQLKNSSFFLINNDVTQKTIQVKTDSLIITSLESGNKRLTKKKIKGK